MAAPLARFVSCLPPPALLRATPGLQRQALQGTSWNSSAHLRCQQNRPASSSAIVCGAAATSTSSVVAAAADATSADGASICVLGAGVIGLTAALRIKQAMPESTVTVVAEKFDFDTTSFGAGGLWKPYTLGDTPAHLVNKWGKETFDHYMSLYQSPEAPTAGTILTSAYQLWTQPVPDPEWTSVVPHFRHLTPRELSLYDPQGTHTHGWFYTTFITEGRLYLRWLTRQLEQGGTRLLSQHVSSVDELAGYDVVVNCSGLGARQLFGDDSVYPVRGHVLRVRAPWVRHYVNAECPGKDTYIIPNTDTVVLGGTLGKGDFDTTPRMEDRQGILDRACAVLPSLRAAEIVGEWVGLRPGRPSVRLELEYLTVNTQPSQQQQQCGSGKGSSSSGEQRKSLPVVHSYGHGGAGLTLAWGCAADAVELVQQALSQQQQGQQQN